jgi:hypothetical protein
MRVQFQVTIDDCVDATQRVLARSKTVRGLRSRDMVITAMSCGIISYALTRNVIVAIIGAIVSGVIYLPLRDYMTKRRLRKYFVEAHKTEGAIDLQVELTSTGIHTKQSGTQSIYDWDNVDAITETDDSVDIFLKQGGGLIVRKRAFTSADQQKQFVALADEYRKQKAELIGNNRP